jgi:hypothetical protein
LVNYAKELNFKPRKKSYAKKVKKLKMHWVDIRFLLSIFIFLRINKARRNIKIKKYIKWKIVKWMKMWKGRKTKKK